MLPPIPVSCQCLIPCVFAAELSRSFRIPSLVLDDLQQERARRAISDQVERRRLALALPKLNVGKDIRVLDRPGEYCTVVQ
jgi:hypothetical protein